MLATCVTGPVLPLAFMLPASAAASGYACRPGSAIISVRAGAPAGSTLTRRRLARLEAWSDSKPPAFSAVTM